LLTPTNSCCIIYMEGLSKLSDHQFSWSPAFILFFFFYLSPIPSRFNHSIKDWQFRQVWLFVLCQEHSADINYQCWLHWHPIKINKVVDRLSHASFHSYVCTIFRWFVVAGEIGNLRIFQSFVATYVRIRS
jgi:hypothetical protein